MSKNKKKVRDRKNFDISDLEKKNKKEITMPPKAKLLASGDGSKKISDFFKGPQKTITNINSNTTFDIGNRCCSWHHVQQIKKGKTVGREPHFWSEIVFDCPDVVVRLKERDKVKVKSNDGKSLKLYFAGLKLQKGGADELINMTHGFCISHINLFIEENVKEEDLSKEDFKDWYFFFLDSKDQYRQMTDKELEIIFPTTLKLNDMTSNIIKIRGYYLPKIPPFLFERAKDDIVKKVLEYKSTININHLVESDKRLNKKLITMSQEDEQNLSNQISKITNRFINGKSKPEPTKEQESDDEDNQSEPDNIEEDIAEGGASTKLTDSQPNMGKNNNGVEQQIEDEPEEVMDDDEVNEPAPEPTPPPKKVETKPKQKVEKKEEPAAPKQKSKPKKEEEEEPMEEEDSILDFAPKKVATPAKQVATAPVRIPKVAAPPTKVTEKKPVPLSSIAKRKTTEEVEDEVEQQPLQPTPKKSKQEEIVTKKQTNENVKATGNGNATSTAKKPTGFGLNNKLGVYSAPSKPLVQSDLSNLIPESEVIGTGADIYFSYRPPNESELEQIKKKDAVEKLKNVAKNIHETKFKGIPEKKKKVEEEQEANEEVNEEVNEAANEEEEVVVEKRPKGIKTNMKFLQTQQVAQTQESDIKSALESMGDDISKIDASKIANRRMIVLSLMKLAADDKVANPLAGLSGEEVFEMMVDYMWFFKHYLTPVINTSDPYGKNGTIETLQNKKFETAMKIGIALCRKEILESNYKPPAEKKKK